MSVTHFYKNHQERFVVPLSQEEAFVKIVDAIQGKEKLIIIFRGPSGSGKTHMARELFFAGFRDTKLLKLDIIDHNAYHVVDENGEHINPEEYYYYDIPKHPKMHSQANTAFSHQSISFNWSIDGVKFAVDDINEYAQAALNRNDIPVIVGAYTKFRDLDDLKEIAKKNKASLLYFQFNDFVAESGNCPTDKLALNFNRFERM